MTTETEPDSEPERDDPTTRWSMVQRLDGHDADEAWRWLMRTYTPFAVRRLSSVCRRWNGFNRSKIEHELVPEFWGYACERRIAERADQARQFRRFLFGCLRNFAREYRRAESRPTSLVDDEFLARLADTDTEHEYVRDWALGLIGWAIYAVRKTNRNWADALVLYYGISEDPNEHREPMAAVDVKKATGIKDLQSLLYKARNMLRTKLMALLQDSAADPDDLEEEIGLLKSALDREHPPGLFQRPS